MQRQGLWLASEQTSRKASRSLRHRSRSSVARMVATAAAFSRAWASSLAACARFKWV